MTESHWCQPLLDDTVCLVNKDPASKSVCIRNKTSEYASCACTVSISLSDQECDIAYVALNVDEWCWAVAERWRENASECTMMTGAGCLVNCTGQGLPRCMCVSMISRISSKTAQLQRHKALRKLCDIAAQNHEHVHAHKRRRLCRQRARLQKVSFTAAGQCEAMQPGWGNMQIAAILQASA